MSATNSIDPTTPAGVHSFVFGDPMPILAQQDLLDCIECAHNGVWYEPPVSFFGLARVLNSAVHHQSAITFKRRVLMSCFVPHPLLSRRDASAFVQDFLVFGNAYFEVKKNRLGELLALKHVPAKYMRRGIKPGAYWFVTEESEDFAFAPNSIFHLLEPDVHQEIYGLPSYLAAIPSMLLNEEATLFRRKYYINGSHAGVLVYLTDPVQNETEVEKLKKTLTDSRGAGAFKNLFLYAAGGKKDGIQILPFSEITAKDEFSGIKNVTRDDLLAAHRVPPQLMGLVPHNAGGFGDVEKVARVFANNELAPIMEDLGAVNDFVGCDVLRFKPYTLTQ